MKERVDIVNSQLNQYDWPEYLRVIDSTHLTAEETLHQIELTD